ncbi:hypothetical protein ALC57_04330, partial [Trachymyrmex cornetzi]
RLTANVFIRAVSAVFFSVTEETSLDTGSVTAREQAVLTERFLSVNHGFGLPLFVLQLAVVDGILPVAGLLIDVEVQTSRASYCLQTGTRALNNVTAIVTLARDQSEPLPRILVLTNLVLEALFFLLFLPFNSDRAL